MSVSGLHPLKNDKEPTAVLPISNILRRPCVQSTYVHYRGTSDGSKKKGMTICNTNEFVQSQFSDGVLIVRYINKMGTNGGGGVVASRSRNSCERGV